MRKNRFLETENVFLDASIFEEQNFFHGTKMHSISNYANRGVINLHMTALSKMELEDRIRKKISKCRAETKALERKYNDQNIRFIKNLNIFEKRQILQFSYSEEKEIFRKFDSFIKRAKVKTITTHNFPVLDVFKSYYAGSPPFGSGKKKHEFIDAFILKTLESWCIRHGQKMYVLSKDPDFLKYNSEHLIISDDLGGLLDRISDYYNQRFKLRKSKFIKDYINSNTKAIEDLVSPMISDKLIIKNKEGTILKHEISKAEIHKYNIISYRDDYSEIEILFKIYADLLLVSDVDDFLLDDHDIITRSKNISYTTIIPVDLELSGKKLIVKWINSSQEYIIGNNNDSYQ